MNLMPALFVGHGSPMNAIEKNIWSDQWKKLRQQIPTPQVILSISAHWMSSGAVYTAPQETPETIHDFYGFPEELFRIQYSAPGSPDTVKIIQEMIPNIELNTQWGIDHGTWSVLVHLFPEANIPVVQISLDLSQPFEFHYRLGQTLAPLRKEGILIFGTGNIVHNLRAITWEQEYYGLPWAKEFDLFATQKMNQHDHLSLLNPFSHNGAARLAIPTPDHYLPLLYVLAAQSERDHLSYPVEGFSLGSLSMRSVLLTE